MADGRHRTVPPGNGVRALAALGLGDKLIDRAVRISHQRILNHTGRQLAEVELSKLWDPVGPCVGIARSELHSILADGAAGVPMRLGTTLTALSQKHDGVHISFADGSTGRYDLVVGADGIHSSVRRLAFGNVHPRYLGHVSWRFLIDHVDHVGARSTWTAMLAPRQAFLTLPVAPQRLYCYADLVAFAPEDPTGRDLSRFRDLFAEFADPVPGILSRLDNFDSIHFSPIEEIVIDTWVQGRVVLIGDAAHATSPNMAEGASMALEDALVLSQVLAIHGSLDEALFAFGERRRTRIRGCRSEHTAGIASAVCQFRFAISRSDWRGRRFISVTIACCSKNHSQRQECEEELEYVKMGRRDSERRVSWDANPAMIRSNRA
jgi:2-polyprenyl-6-methoxyphenol hydroxylase-like FAD-dependent oxidoreductase